VPEKVEITSKGIWRLLDRLIFATRGRGRWVAGLLVLAYAGFWLAGGVYTVDTQITGVLQRFGAVIDDAVPSGIHYRLPDPIDTVTFVPTARVQRVEVRTDGPDRTTSDSAYVTGDENLIEVALAVQYKIRDAAPYVFSTDAHEALIQGTAQSALTEIVATMDVDDVLTVGKARIQRFVQERAQRLLDAYGMGVVLVSVTVSRVEPPREVSFDFKAVSDAKAEARRIVSEAHARRNDLIPKARGQAAKVLGEARSYATERVEGARGDADRFLAVLAEYQKARATTEKRLYLETMERILPKVKKYVLSKSEGGTSPKVNLR